MFFLVFFIIVFIIIYQNNRISNNNHNIYSLLRKLFKNKYFHDVTKLPASNSNITMFFASSHGENYLLGVDRSFLLLNSVILLYETAQKNHIHNTVLITKSSKDLSGTLLKRIQEYNIQVWDKTKLISLVNKSGSPLVTSNTSDDKCVIETNSNDPIQDSSSNSLFKNLFRKPDRL